jgi:hypothetical protein
VFEHLVMTMKLLYREKHESAISIKRAYQESLQSHESGQASNCATYDLTAHRAGILNWSAATPTSITEALDSVNPKQF